MVLEKYHTARIRLCAPNTAYARLANRFLKECEEVLNNIPAEIELAAKAIRRGAQPDDAEDSGSYPRSYLYDGIYWQKQWEWRFSASEEDDTYVFDYYFFASEQYDATYCGVKHKAGSSSEIREMICRQKGPIRYFCTHRPPSPGGIPDGFVTFESYPSSSRCRTHGHIGEVTYSTPPPAEELRRWGLTRDPDWLREWSAKGFKIHDLDSSVEHENGLSEEEAKKCLSALTSRLKPSRRRSCPRCGQTRFSERFGKPEKSRYVDVSICGACFVHESGLEQAGQPLPLRKWAYAKAAAFWDETIAYQALTRGELPKYI